MFMEKSSTSSEKSTVLATTEDAKPKERILFEIQPLVLPTILNLENLTIVTFSFIIVVVAVTFHLGFSELLIIFLLYSLIAFPSIRSIFRAGSTSYVLTSRRLILFTIGVRSRELSIPLTQIQDVKVKSSGLQGVYGAGDILIYQKQLRGVVRLQGLKDCKRRAEQIRQAMKAQKA
jgi:hypothetical protein